MIEIVYTQEQKDELKRRMNFLKSFKIELCVVSVVFFAALCLGCYFIYLSKTLLGVITILFTLFPWILSIFFAVFGNRFNKVVNSGNYKVMRTTCKNITNIQGAYWKKVLAENGLELYYFPYNSNLQPGDKVDEIIFGKNKNFVFFVDPVIINGGK